METPNPPLSLDDDLAELREIRLQLETSEDPDTRISLVERQRELRLRWASGLGKVSTERLLAMRNGLHARRRAALEGRFDIAFTGNGSGENGGLDPLVTMEHNRVIDEANDFSGIEAEIRSVEAELRNRGVDRWT